MFERRPRGSGRGWERPIEGLEARALLATSALTATDVTGLIWQAVHHGVNTGPAVIHRMTAALQTQLTDGPLAGLQDGTLTEPEFEDEVAAIVADFDATVDADLARFPHIAAILKRQGDAVEADIRALAAEQTVGRIDAAGYEAGAATAIDGLTAGPLRPLHTPYSAYVTVTKAFEAQLDGVVAGLDDTTAPLTVDEAQSLVTAYADAYRADTASALYLRPGVQSRIDAALVDLTTAAAGLTADEAAAQLQDAIVAFDDAILDTTGLFGPQGPVVWHLHHGRKA